MPMAIKRWRKYLEAPVEAAPLAAFRIFFGLMMMAGIIRFWALGWIDKLYLQPAFHFTYFGFEWVQPLGMNTYALFAICGLAALGVALGFWYRLSATVFFLSFTYIELMDKTTYLNHYYFVSVVSFILILLPAQRYFSIDARRNPSQAAQHIPRWSIGTIKLILGLVYFYAGLAKLNSDWLLQAQPLATWLPGRYDLPIIGGLLEQTWTHYAFSWAGALYDLAIPFLLLYQPTRKFAFVLVVVFHVLTRLLFPIGMFPYIMIVSALIFFSSDFHHRVLALLSKWLKLGKSYFDNNKAWEPKRSGPNKVRLSLLVLVLLVQVLVPWRYLLYPGELFWHEQGFRFSWRVMLMEKSGYVNFKVVDLENGERFYVDNAKHLSAFQEKQMSFQPDFILEYAHFLEKYYQQEQNRGDLAVYADSHVALNGRPSQPFVNPEVDLTQVERGWKARHWLLPLNDAIYGL